MELIYKEKLIKPTEELKIVAEFAKINPRDYLSCFEQVKILRAAYLRNLRVYINSFLSEHGIEYRFPEGAETISATLNGAEVHLSYSIFDVSSYALEAQDIIEFNLRSCIFNSDEDISREVITCGTGDSLYLEDSGTIVNMLFPAIYHNNSSIFLPLDLYPDLTRLDTRLEIETTLKIIEGDPKAFERLSITDYLRTVSSFSFLEKIEAGYISPPCNTVPNLVYSDSGSEGYFNLSQFISEEIDKDKNPFYNLCVQFNRLGLILWPGINSSKVYTTSSKIYQADLRSFNKEKYYFYKSLENEVKSPGIEFIRKVDLKLGSFRFKLTSIERPKIDRVRLELLVSQYDVEVNMTHAFNL